MTSNQHAWRSFLISGLVLGSVLSATVVILLWPTFSSPRIHPVQDEVLDHLVAANARLLRLSLPDPLAASEAAAEARRRAARPLVLHDQAPVQEGSVPVVVSHGGEKHAGGDGLRSAIALVDQGRTAEAVAALEALIAANPQHEQALVELAMLNLLDLGHKDKALELMRRVVVLNPKNQIVLSELVSLYDEDQRWDEGLSFLQGLDKEHQGSPELAYSMGTLLMNAGREADAIAHLERAAEAPEAHRALRDLAEAYARSGASDKALETYNRTLQSLERDLADKRYKGLPTGYIEERIHYTKLDQVSELIRSGDFDRAQTLIDEAARANPADEGVMALQQHLNARRAG